MRPCKCQCVLFPVSSGIKAANSEGLKLVGGLLITVSATGPDGNTRSGSHMCNVSETVTRLFLSKAACRDLGIIGDNFPEVGSSDFPVSGPARHRPCGDLAGAPNVPPPGQRLSPCGSTSSRPPSRLRWS